MITVLNYVKFFQEKCTMHVVRKSSCCRNWPRFCVRSRGWTRHHARVGSPVAPRTARSRATPRVRGGASNHGSWRKNVVNFHSTTIINVVAFKPCNYLNRITRSWIGITSLKSTPPSSESTLLCTRDDVTMAHECKQSTTTSRTHAKKNFQVNTFHDDFKREWISIVTVYVYEVIWSKHFHSIKWNYDNRIGVSLWRSWCYLICIITRGLCSYNARLFNDDVTAIRVSYWLRREFPNYARLHRGRMWFHWFLQIKAMLGSDMKASGFTIMD